MIIPHSVICAQRPFIMDAKGRDAFKTPFICTLENPPFQFSYGYSSTLMF